VQQLNNVTSIMRFRIR